MHSWWGHILQLKLKSSVKANSLTSGFTYNWETSYCNIISTSLQTHHTVSLVWLISLIIIEYLHSLLTKCLDVFGSDSTKQISRVSPRSSVASRQDGAPARLTGSAFPRLPDLPSPRQSWVEELRDKQKGLPDLYRTEVVTKRDPDHLEVLETILSKHLYGYFLLEWGVFETSMQFEEPSQRLLQGKSNIQCNKWAWICSIFLDIHWRSGPRFQVLRPWRTETAFDPRNPGSVLPGQCWFALVAIVISTQVVLPIQDVRNLHNNTPNRACLIDWPLMPVLDSLLFFDMHFGWIASFGAYEIQH